MQVNFLDKNYDLTSLYNINKNDKVSEKDSENEEKKSDVECFKELCRRFTNASFFVEDKSLEYTDAEWLPERFLSDTDLNTFSQPGVFSVSLDVNVLQKASQDPEFMEKLSKFMDSLQKEYVGMSKSCEAEGAIYCKADVWLDEDGKIRKSYMLSTASMILYSNYKENKNTSTDEDDSAIKRVIREFESKKQDGLIRMMDMIYEDTEETNKQVEKQEKHERYLKRLEKYEASFRYE